MTDFEEISKRCDNVLPGHGSRTSLKAIFQSLADACETDDYFDSYGFGVGIADLEAEVAARFGKAAAAFFPTGTMAQQIALRIWCQRHGNFTVAMHPTAHPDFAEHLGYRHLHRIERLQFGAPEFVADRVLTVEDFAELGQNPGAILLELPYRPLGGELPDWNTLEEIRAWASDREISMHLDGARIWSCRPFYGKDYAEIASIFDSVYVSFYKDLGGLAGAMLLGPEDFIAEAKVWRIRHGGRLKTFAPFVVSARLALDHVLPQIDRWVERAREIAAILGKFDRLSIHPNPPHTNMFQLYVRGDYRTLTEMHMEAARETGTLLFHRLQPTRIPGIATTEVHCWENASALDINALEPFVSNWLDRTENRQAGRAQE